MQFLDRLVNVVTGLGGQKDKVTGTTHGFVQLSDGELIAAYRGNWIARKVVNIPAFDMVRAGRNWKAEDAQIEKLEAEEQRLGYWPKVAKAVRLARLYGGSALIMGTADNRAAEELVPETVKAGGLAFLHVVSKNSISCGEINRDPGSPLFGEPLFYEVSGAKDGTAATKIHPSRVIRFTGAEVPEEMADGTGWGDSVLQALNEAIVDAGITSAGIAQLITEAKLDVYKIPLFMENIGDPAYANKVIQRFTLGNTMKSLVNGIVLDKDEEYEQKQISFSTLPEILQLFLQIAAGAGDIPATRLLSQAPAGMNSTGESDLRNYYDRLSAEQELDLRPRVSRLDELLIRSALGDRPPEIHYTFAPLWQISAKEQAEIFNTKATAARTLVGTGGTSPEIIPILAMSDALANSLVEDGSLPGLEAALEEHGTLAEQPEETPEEIAAAMVQAQAVPGAVPAGGTPPMRRAANDAALRAYVDSLTADERRELVEMAKRAVG